MSRLSTTATCPHCNGKLQRVRLPVETGYDQPDHLVCFNDECPYYREGWEWMKQQYEAKASYRYRIDPSTGAASPIPIWSETALRDRIVDDPEG